MLSPTNLYVVCFDSSAMPIVLDSSEISDVATLLSDSGGSVKLEEEGDAGRILSETDRYD